MTADNDECPNCYGCGEIETLKGDVLPCPTCMSADISEERAALCKERDELAAKLAVVVGAAQKAKEALCHSSHLLGVSDGSGCNQFACPACIVEAATANLPARAQAVMDVVAIAREFCERVDRGEVRSVKTYAKFKDALGARTTDGKDRTP